MTFAAKLTQLTSIYNRAAVARLVGITPSAFQALCRGRFSPSVSTAKAIAGVLGVEIGWMLDDSKRWPPTRICPLTDSLPSKREKTRGAA